MTKIQWRQFNAVRIPTGDAEMPISFVLSAAALLTVLTIVWLVIRGSHHDHKDHAAWSELDEENKEE
jgi:hypothetical protein